MLPALHQPPFPPPPHKFSTCAAGLWYKAGTGACEAGGVTKGLDVRLRAGHECNNLDTRLGHDSLAGYEAGVRAWV